MVEQVTKRRKGMKATMLDLNKNEKVNLPRRSYSTIRTTISNLKIEYPEREFIYEVVEDGILVSCLK